MLASISAGPGTSDGLKGSPHHANRRIRVPVSITRRRFLASTALAGGAIGLGTLLPKGLTGLAGAATSGHCQLGGNTEFINEEESKLGQTLSLHRVYKGWEEELFTSDVVQSAEKGRRLIISVFPARRDGSGVKRWGDIASGKYDNGLGSIASQLKAFAKSHSRKVGLCFHHEPEDNRDGTPGPIHHGKEADFRAAAKHFFSYLSSHGVTNIRSTVILLGSTYAAGQADAYWPGSQYVDRVGVDCYNWYGSEEHPDAQWRSFQQIVQGTYDFADRKRKQMWVCETGTLEDPHDPDRKAQWITAMGDTLKTMPRIKRVMWWMGGPNGFSLSQPPEGSSSALGRFKDLLQQPYFT
jgi:hypothetical protein